LEGIQAWVEELRQRGYTNGQNLQIDCRYYFWDGGHAWPDDPAVDAGTDR
jgi:hypothetical protein